MEEEGPISHNGRMVDKSKIVDGLTQIKDFLAGRGEMTYATEEDIAYFEEVIEAAKDYLLED